MRVCRVVSLVSAVIFVALTVNDPGLWTRGLYRRRFEERCERSERRNGVQSDGDDHQRRHRYRGHRKSDDHGLYVLTGLRPAVTR